MENKQYLRWLDLGQLKSDCHQRISQSDELLFYEALRARLLQFYLYQLAFETAHLGALDQWLRFNHQQIPSIGGFELGQRRFFLATNVLVHQNSLPTKKAWLRFRSEPCHRLLI
jgi:hypothetical protein